MRRVFSMWAVVAATAMFLAPVAHAQFGPPPNSGGPSGAPPTPLPQTTPYRSNNVFVVPPGPAIPTWYQYWDVDGWGWLRVDVTGTNPYTQTQLVRVQLWQLQSFWGWRYFSGVGSATGGKLSFTLAGYHFEGQQFAWGTYQHPSLPQSPLWFWLQ